MGNNGTGQETYFAPAEREGPAVIARQRALFESDALALGLLSAVPDIFLVLNQQRQIVYANDALLDAFGVQDQMCIYGKRPGEVIGCVNAETCTGGCGTSEACSLCGAVKAILVGLEGKRESSECRILRNDGLDALDLRVYANPFEIQGERFCVFAIVNISDEKRRRALERIFFHDILNTAGGLIGFTELMKDASEDELEEFARMVSGLATRLVDEIRGQQQLAAAETGELVATPSPATTAALLDSLAATFRHHEAARGKSLTIAETAAHVELVTDATLLSRVLVNLTKNAFEASRAGDTVTVDCQADEAQVTFSVHNRTFMPRDVQLQMFQRSFSTKGHNRGLGSYSAKLITERCLKGRLWFTTSEEQGTTFSAQLKRAFD